ncbi:MAG: hypothetical protein OEZ34_07710, partial [Spirochaetia bacterium]|nr:hypothetical protein [Spirochaetia bacterium]
FKISEITNIEKTIVKYPETDSKKVPENKSQNQSYTSFANPSPVPSENENSLSGKYLIKIGTFPDATADSLTRRLNNDPKLLQIKPYQCSGVEENVPERYIAFRTKAGNSGQNVFLGCFQKKWQALNAMKSVQESNINGTGSAQLFEIE